jgi:peroxiredoxin Q/BCP
MLPRVDKKAFSVYLLGKAQSRSNFPGGGPMRKYVVFAIMLLVVVSAAPQATGVTLLQVGDRAPDFTAESTKGTVTLSQYRGEKHVVLAFYFADFTPV